MFLVPTDLAGGRGLLEFFNTATAGGNTSYIIEGSEAGPDGGRINFWDSSTAGDASFVLEGAGHNAGTTGGLIFFMDTSTAGNATFDCQSGGSGNGTLAAVDFVDNSSAGNATLIAEGVNGVGSFNGIVLIRGESTAANATLIANDGRPGGVLYFDGSSTGDHATVKVYGNGNMQMAIAGTSLTIGSLEGNGIVFLSDKELTVGNNGQSTTFSGIIQDSGSLVKIKKGKFVLANANTYAGGTTVKGGSLFANNSDGSATGTGPVKVNAGTLAGRGTIAGPVTVGSGGAFLAPAGPEIGVLKMQASLTFKTQATYLVELNSSSARADKVVASGVTIDSAALISVTDLGNAVLASGTVFRMISNISVASIMGTFANLPDGSTLVVGNNTFQASYEGGDGNDLTLTVVQ
jgi:autotransporter-associated beta strand protein